jgi:hypothetical protein
MCVPGSKNETSVPSSKNETRSANIPIQKAPAAKLHAPPGPVGFLGQRLRDEQAAKKAAERSAKKTTAVIKAVIDKLWELGYGLSENEADDDTQFPMDDV